MYIIDKRPPTIQCEELITSESQSVLAYQICNYTGYSNHQKHRRQNYVPIFLEFFASTLNLCQHIFHQTDKESVKRIKLNSKLHAIKQNSKLHAMPTRHSEKYAANKKSSERYAKSALPNMIRLLNDSDRKKNELIRSVSSYNVPMNYGTRLSLSLC